jgi:hypothetical protein
VLTGLYLGTAAAGFALLAASIVKELFFHHPMVELPRSSLSAENPDPRELLDCQGRVEGLLVRLGHETCELMGLPPSGEQAELPARWESFSRAWSDEWDVANARCRFSELGGTKLGIAYDRLASVMSDLPSMRLKYQSLLVRFDDEQAAELARMRHDLDLSRAAFEDKVHEAAPAVPAGGSQAEPTPPPPPAGSAP